MAKRFVLLAILALAALPAPRARAASPRQSGVQHGPSTTALATIREIRRFLLPDVVRVIIELDTEVSFHEERIAGPDRVFIDLAAARARPSLGDQTLRFTSDLVRQIRIGRHPHDTTRIVLDAAGVSSYSVYPLYNPYRLVIDCVRETPLSPPPPPVLRAAAPPLPALRTPAASLPAVRIPAPPLPVLRTTPLLAARAFSNNWAPRLPASVPRASAAIREASAADPPVAPPLPPVASSLAPLVAPPVTAPARNLAGGFSIARQLGLGVSRIVIDPGHGGHDPGAKGRGIDEADLVLDVALRLEAMLQKIPGVEVVLTRRTNEFIPLQERTAIANREGADLFLSIHANASTNRQARGVETYFLNFANNLSAAAVAARENAASGQAMGALPDIVKAIALNNKIDESRDFARMVQRSMLERLRGANKGVKDLGVKQAPFVVLIGAAMPSVLAEISFVTNAQEAKLLHGTTYRQRIADALLNAIKKYQTSLNSVGTVAQQ